MLYDCARFFVLMVCADALVSWALWIFRLLSQNHRIHDVTFVVFHLRRGSDDSMWCRCMFWLRSLLLLQFITCGSC